MDESSNKLRLLFRKVDDAFQELMAAPNSHTHNEAYQDAKRELDDYLKSLRDAFNNGQGGTPEH